MNKKQCAICSQIKGDSLNDLIFNNVGGEYIRRIAFETDSLACVPSLAPLSKGHWLLCPKEHFISVAEMIEAIPYAEINHLRFKLATFLSTRYGRFVHQFEHGSANGSDRIICGTGHAHLHFVLSEKHQLTLPSGMKWEPVRSDLGDLAAIVQGREYAYYCNAQSQSFVVVAKDEPIPSQFMRKWFAEQSGTEVAGNWLDALNVGETLRTFEDYSIPQVQLVN